MADPSHATGDPALVVPMALAALAAGADGVIVEVHPEPASALSDGFQAIAPAELTPLVDQLRAVASALGRSVHASQPPSQGQSGA
jgi:3-deoxy-D-arabino-heptulosonate 7-phosphate (DAHP) synthase